MTRAWPLLAVLSLTATATATARADEPVERRLHADQVSASSFLWNDWNRFQENYHPLYVSDGDPKTAWVEGAASSGAGEWIRMQVTEMEGATRVRLRVRSGYQKSPSLFTANARPKDVTIKLLPSEKTTKFTFADAEGFQELTAEQPAGKLEAVELRIDSVYEGSKYKDLCISDVELYVTATTRENPAFEKSKLSKVTAWKGERLDAAKLFKQAGAKEMPLLPAYKLVTSEGGTEVNIWEGCSDQVCQVKKTLEAAGHLSAKHGEALKLALAALTEQGTVPARLAPTDKRPFPAIDGVYVPNLYQAVEEDFGNQGVELPVVGLVAALEADKLGVLQLEGKDVKATRDQVIKAKADGCKTKKGRTYSWLLRDKAPEGSADAGRDRVRALAFVRCGRVEMREGYDNVGLLQVAVYDGEGRLELTLGSGYINVFSWGKNGTQPVINSAQAFYADGRKGELTTPEVARAP